MSIPLALRIANQISQLSETNTIVIHQPTFDDYNAITYKKFLAYDIAKFINPDSGYSFHSNIGSFMSFKNFEKGTYVIVLPIVDAIFDDYIEVVCFYCKDSDEFVKLYISM